MLGDGVRVVVLGGVLPAAEGAVAHSNHVQSLILHTPAIRKFLAR